MMELHVESLTVVLLLFVNLDHVKYELLIVAMMIYVHTMNDVILKTDVLLLLIHASFLHVSIIAVMIKVHVMPSHKLIPSLKRSMLSLTMRNTHNY